MLQVKMGWTCSSQTRYRPTAHTSSSSNSFYNKISCRRLCYTQLLYFIRWNALQSPQLITAEGWKIPPQTEYTHRHNQITTGLLLLQKTSLNTEILIDYKSLLQMKTKNERREWETEVDRQTDRHRYKIISSQRDGEVWRHWSVIRN